MQTIVDVKSVEKCYGQTQVINHCSFKIQEGEIYGLLGINGAGKTTLMKMILGLQQIDNGSIYVLGQEVSSNREYLSNVGSVIENPAFYEHLSANELLAMHLSYMKKKANIAEVLRLVGLENVNQKPKVIAVILTVSMCAQPLGNALYGVLFEICKGLEYIVVLFAGIVSLMIAIGTRNIFKKLSPEVK